MKAFQDDTMGSDTKEHKFFDKIKNIVGKAGTFWLIL